MRPRLADRVQVRLHRVDGQPRAVLVDAASSREAHVGLREWRLLSCCDGTRDLEGIVLAAAQRGTRTTTEELRRFLTGLDAAGMIEEGPLSPPRDEAPALPLRAIRPLPGFSFRCDGRGTCCRFYDTVGFRPDEVLRARAVAGEVLDCGSHASDAFSPERGSTRVPWRTAAVSLVDGRCAFLEPDDRCGLHRRAGEAAKPLGCRIFPMTLVDDGRELRLGPRPECACVFRSARSATGTSSALTVDPGAHVAVLGDLEDLSREAYLAWADRLVFDDADGAAWLRARTRELGDDRGDEADELARLLARRSEDWRAASDIAPRVAAWVARALALGQASPRPDEPFYLRAVAHLHLWALDGVGLGAALRRRALVLELARHLPTLYEGPSDPAQDEPVALVEALATKIGFLAAGR